MTVSQAQLVDLLLKKVAYGVAKTDTATNKGPTNESNASPMVSPGSTIYQQDYYIPTVTVLPTSNTVVNGSTIVAVYRDSLSSTVQCVNLTEGIANETWTTGLQDWVPPQYGTGYSVSVYTGPSGSATPQNYIQLFPAGSGANDSWYFDYQAGILNFPDTIVPTAVAGNVVYVVGARYTGIKGINSFANVSVTGNITTTSGNLNVTGGNIYAQNFFGTFQGTVTNAYMDRGNDLNDWNTVTTMGVYLINRSSWSGTSNTPINSQYFSGQLEVVNTGNVSITQYYRPYNSTITGDVYWTRSKYSTNAWSTWVEIINGAETVDGGSF